MDDRKLLRVGIAGSVITALCCFTPLLVGLLTVVGFSAAIGSLDLVLLPALVGFVAITIYAGLRRRRARVCGAPHG